VALNAVSAFPDRPTKKSGMDARVTRTKHSILDAFVGLVLDRRYDKITASDLIAASGVGRSTFYEHFRGKDEVLLAAMEPLLLTLANAALGRASTAQVQAMLDHVWEQRAFGRVILNSRAALRVQRRLADLIGARLADGTVPPAMQAMSAAAGQLAMLRMWLAGEVSCPSDSLAAEMIRRT
jgi:AcrR family transcriptional regulator